MSMFFSMRSTPKNDLLYIRHDSAEKDGNASFTSLITGASSDCFLSLIPYIFYAPVPKYFCPEARLIKAYEAFISEYPE